MDSARGEGGGTRKRDGNERGKVSKMPNAKNPEELLLEQNAYIPKKTHPGPLSHRKYNKIEEEHNYPSTPA